MKQRVLATLVALSISACATSTITPPPAETPGSASAPADAGVAVALGGGLGVERLHVVSTLERPAPPELVAAYRPRLVDDHCVDRDLPAPTATDPVFTVLDRSYALAPGYEPSDLVAASAAGLTGVSANKLVRSVMIDDLAAMRAAWEAAGLAIAIESAYRSYASQAATFDIWTARLGPEAASLRTARPGHSEHQLGTAIDFSSPGWSGRVGDWAVESAEGAWMAEHAWEYGFVMSYPAEAQIDTCYAYEPWHYRWIGRDAAAEQRSSGLRLRQFLERYLVA